MDQDVKLSFFVAVKGLFVLPLSGVFQAGVARFLVLRVKR